MYPKKFRLGIVEMNDRAASVSQPQPGLKVILQKNSFVLLQRSISFLSTRWILRL